MHKTFTIVSVVVLVFVFVFASMSNAQVRRNRLVATGVEQSVKHDGRRRQYRIYVPETRNRDSKLPVVFLLHGGGGTAEQASSLGLSRIADKHEFIAVYPEGLNRH